MSQPRIEMNATMLPNGKILTVRADDVRALAAVLDTTPDVLSTRFEELGLRAHQFA